jgi:hypothetical protein
MYESRRAISQSPPEVLMKSSTLILSSLALATGLLALPSTEEAKIMPRDPIDATVSFTTGPERSAPPFIPRPFSDCDIARDNCGSVAPTEDTAWIADGAHNTADSTLFFVAVPYEGDAVFQMDPATCSVVEGTVYSVNGGLTQRGVGYDAEHHEIWVGSWNDGYLNQHSAVPPYPAISYNYTGHSIASIAVDDAHDYLFVGTNSYPDHVYVYDISGGVLGSMLGAWAVPWQSPGYGWAMAGMGYDDDAEQLVMVNQNGNYDGTVREVFDFSVDEGLTGASWCDLGSTGFGWGIGVIEDGDPAPTSFTSYVTDIGDFEAPVEIDEYGIPLVYPPYDLWCSVTEDNDVQLNWTNAEEYDEVRIYLDDELIATLPGDATEYLDHHPGGGYHTYGVSGIIGPDESGRVECSLSFYEWPMCFDFNSSDGGWTVGGIADWEWGYPSYVFDGNAWETNIGENYFNNACGWLESPVINFGPEGGWITCDTYDYTECSYDGWNLQMSLDGGATWEVITALEGYDQGAPYGAANCPEFLGGDSNCGYGVARYWNFDLTSHPNVSARFRFVFASDASVTYTGVVVDNFCIYGGSIPAVQVQCQLLNPDMDGDGIRDVHVGDYLYYSATFVNLSWWGDPQDYGAAHLVYARQSCPNPDDPVIEVGPVCKGTLPDEGVRTHYYRILIPNNDNLLNFNPFAIEVAGWECASGVPVSETMRACFGVTLSPAWEPPPVPEPMTGFVVEEIDGPPAFQRLTSP